MLKPGDRHLTEDELDRLADALGQSDPAPRQGIMPDLNAADHLSGCEDCRRRFDRRIEATRQLSLLRTPRSGASGELCPSDEEWMKVATGLTDQDASQTMLDHAASCDHCGPLLHDLIQEFSEPTTSAENEIVANLQSSSSDWQTGMAGRLSASAGPHKRLTRGSFMSWSWKWPAFGGAVAALAAVVVWALLPQSERRVEHLLSEAYTEHRNLELRIPGAAFAPVRIERGQQSSHLDSPRSLLEAENEIAKNLAKDPSDPFWLQSRARAELLEGNYAAAIDALRQALAAKANSPSLLTDLATAYSQRGDSTGNPEDYGKAVDLLGQALRASPRDPVVLFNRAVVARKALLFSQAIEDWKVYLEVEPRGKWADEARSRMEEAQQEQSKRKHSSLGPLLTPSQFAQLRLDDPAVVAAVDDRFESYSAVAVSQWLPAAYSTDPSNSSDANTARGALTNLAKISLSRHSDRWWMDLLHQAAPPFFPRAVSYLSSSITANESGATEIAHQNATQAIQYFRSAGGNEAGLLRARVEDLYASNIEQNAAKCGPLLPALQNVARVSNYRWLEIEGLIQQGNCRWLEGNLGDAMAAYSAAAARARDSDYRAIQLGAQDHWSMAAGASGDYAGAWRVATEGLKQFWDGDFEDVRGYNFYYSLYEVARLQQLPFLQVSIWKDAIPLTQSSHDLAQVAVAHSLFANSALATHDLTEALQEYDHASQLFARSPQVEATQLAHLEAEARLAGVELSVGEERTALRRLRSIEPEIAHRSDNYLKALFYDNYGRALVAEGNAAEAEKALKSAVSLADLQLQSVRDETSRIEWKVNASGPYRDLVTLTFRKGDPETALELWETFKAAPARFSMHAGKSTLDSAQSDRSIPTVARRMGDLSRATVIAYAVLPAQLVIWVYDDRGVHSAHRDISAAELATQVESFRELCSNPKSDLHLIHKLARRLYDVLVSPVELYLQSDRTLIVEVDESLNGLPMEALVDAGNHYLGERGPILSSLGLLYDTGEVLTSSIGPGTPALVVAVSAPQNQLGNRLPSLPDVVPEGETVANRFIAAHFLTGPNATLQATLEQIPDSGVFHFAGHTSNSNTTPGLLLADTALSVKSLERLKLSRTQLVVLSSCDTEAGALGTVDAADSLVGYFVRSGVPRIVASRWKVDSALTRQLMDAFYTRLLTGSSVEQSVFQAQKALRGQAATAHPFYWAAFAAFGSGVG